MALVLLFFKPLSYPRFGLVKVACCLKRDKQKVVNLFNKCNKNIPFVKIFFRLKINEGVWFILLSLVLYSLLKFVNRAEQSALKMA